MVILSALILVSGAKTAQLPYELWDLQFANKDQGLLIQTKGAPAEEKEYQNRVYYTSIGNLKPRLIARTEDVQLSNDGTLLATELKDQIVIYSLPTGKKLLSLRGSSLGAFSPDNREYAFMIGAHPGELHTVRLSDGRERVLKNFVKGLAKYAPKNGKLSYQTVSKWEARGLWVSSSYSFATAKGNPYLGVYVSPTTDSIVSLAPARAPRWPLRFTLADGSKVVDEFAEREESMMGECRIVRVHKGKRKVLFAGKDLSAGHEMGAGLVARGNRVLVYAGEGHNATKAWIWDVDPVTGKRTVLVSGKYTMPSRADGNSMFVALSSKGQWLAYGDFTNHRQIHIRRL